MSYYDILKTYKDIPFEEKLARVSPHDVDAAIGSGRDDDQRLLALLSPAARPRLEQMAQAAHSLTLRHFGRTVKLYTPMYVSNHCENPCVYCGFNARHDFPRRKLSPEEVEKESAAISATGLEHILVLTGDSRKQSPPAYIAECVRIIRKYFSSVSLEVYALTAAEYAQMADAGVDGLSIYQETYDEAKYASVHPAGPKRDYHFRLDAPERAAANGLRGVCIGALLGLHQWRTDVFFMGLHARYLRDKFPGVEIGVSLPRLRPCKGGYETPSPVSDRELAQVITALRIFLPRLSINLSTRESPALREGLLPLGITSMSAGSSTRVGGHTGGEKGNEAQFEISDERDVGEIKAMLAAKGYQPVVKDWMRL